MNILDREIDYYDKITKNNVVSYCRSMTHNYDELINKCNYRFDKYYIYYLDGDNWNSVVEKFSHSMSLIFDIYEIIPSKDGILMHSDEVIIFSNIDLDYKLLKINELFNPYGFTILKMIVNNDTVIKNKIEYFKDIRELKKSGKGVIYNV